MKRDNIVLLLTIPAAVFLLMTSIYTTLYMMLASFSFMILCIGFTYRDQPKKHVPLMLTAIGLDVSLVLILEFSRGAINTAASFSLGPFQQLHIFSSLMATLLYIPAVLLGWKLYRKKGAKKGMKNKHIKFAIAAFIFRSVGFVSMFSLLIKK